MGEVVTMMLRHIVTNWIRQTAGQTLHEVVSEAVRGAQYRFGSDATLPDQALPCNVVAVFGESVEAGGTVDLLRSGTSMRCPNFVEHTGYLGETRVAVIESGVGRQAAATAMSDVVALHHPSWVISAGFACALTADLRRGHILMADEVADAEHQCVAIGLPVDRASLAATRTQHIGRLVTVDHLVRAKEEKNRLAADYKAVACDMETMAIAEVCQREQIRFLSVRIITDTLDEELPKEIDRLLAQKSIAARLGVVTGAIFNRPSSIKDLWKLKEDAIKASDRLAKFVAGVVAQLPVEQGPHDSGRLE